MCGACVVEDTISLSALLVDWWCRDDIGEQTRAFFLGIIQSTPWRVLIMLSIVGAVGVSMMLEPNVEETSNSQDVTAVPLNSRTHCWL